MHEIRLDLKRGASVRVMVAISMTVYANRGEWKGIRSHQKLFAELSKSESTCSIPEGKCNHNCFYKSESMQSSSSSSYSIAHLSSSPNSFPTYSVLSSYSVPLSPNRHIRIWFNAIAGLMHSTTMARQVTPNRRAQASICVKQCHHHATMIICDDVTNIEGKSSSVKRFPWKLAIMPTETPVQSRWLI